MDSINNRCHCCHLLYNAVAWKEDMHLYSDGNNGQEIRG